MGAQSPAIENAAVAAVFAAYPPKLRKRLLAVRQMIFEAAKQTEGLGKLQETLKWGEPAYVERERSRAGCGAEDLPRHGADLSQEASARLERGVLIVIAILFLRSAVAPYHSGTSWFVSFDGSEETHIRLQGIPEEQGHVLDHRAEYLVET